MDTKKYGQSIAVAGLVVDIQQEYNAMLNQLMYKQQMAIAKAMYNKMFPLMSTHIEDVINERP